MNMRPLFLLFCILSTLMHLPIAAELQPDVTVRVPMRDGTTLATDLYLPFRDAKNLPCILLRSPAGREAPYWREFAAIAKSGYVVAIQETRSAADKQGKTVPFLADGWGPKQDGYDAIEWLANSPYTNGKVGTWGSSALGITQLLLAPSQPAHLECQYIIMAAASLYHHAIFPGGQLLKHQAESWLGLYAHDTGILSYISQRPMYNDFWKLLNTSSAASRVQAPAIHVGGWYDTFIQGTLEGFKSRQEQGGVGARGKQKLVIGPWTHFWPVVKSLGDFDMSAAGFQPPFDISPQRWFDHYLKGVDNHIEDLSAVIYYVMGPFDGSPSSGNVWKTANAWPVPAHMTAYYLAPANKLNTAHYPQEQRLSYTYDPHNPIPTLGGRNLFLESGPKDQQSIEKRDDILVFTTPPLEEDLEVTGNLQAKLFLTSNQRDTDLIVRLTDVYPDGRSILIADGGRRVGLIKDQDSANPTEVDVDLWATSIVFAKGHSIRVSVSSSNFPRYEKNRNLGLFGDNTGQYAIAQNRIWIGGQTPSRIVLPIVKR